MPIIKKTARILHPLHRLFNYYKSWYEFSIWILQSPRLRQEARSLPPHTLMTLYIHGFFPNKHRIYQLHENDRKLYINDRQMLMSSRIDGQHGIILHDKALFELAMRQFVKVPHNFALIHNRKLTWLDDDTGNDLDLIRLIRQHGKIVLKPTDGVSGKGVKILEYRGDAYYQNDRLIDEGVLPDIFFKAGNVIISEYVHQGQFTSGLYPKTVNTVRMLTMIDPKTQIPFIGAAFLRIGCAQSIPVDNVSSGGISCNIDLATGRLGKGIMNIVTEKPLRQIKRHPEANVPLEGQIIPDWPGICQKMLVLATRFPTLPYVAWDIALLDEGIVVIEGNSWSGLNVFQHNKPMLADERIQRFFKYHRIT